MRSPGQVVGFVPGAWDMFHIGHLNILLRARQHCDHLIAGAVTDEVLFGAKNKFPIVPLDERLEVLASLDLVDEVVVDHASDKLDAFNRYRFDVIFKGDDWRGTAKGDRLERDMAGVGVEVFYFPYTAHTSSTALRTLISERS